MSWEYVIPLFPQRRGRKILTTGLKPTLSKVAMMLADERQESPGVVEISYADLARKSDVTRRTVIDAVEALRARGYLEVLRRGTLNTNLPNTFRLLWEPWQRGSENGSPLASESVKRLHLSGEKNADDVVKNFHLSVPVSALPVPVAPLKAQIRTRKGGRTSDNVDSLKAFVARRQQ